MFSYVDFANFSGISKMTQEFLAASHKLALVHIQYVISKTRAL